jgi:hypothetical protein
MKKATPLLLMLALSVATFAVPMTAHAVSTDVVISQVYGGGGNSGATYQNDFVELYNRSSSPVSLTGWSINYARERHDHADRQLPARLDGGGLRRLRLDHGLPRRQRERPGAHEHDLDQPHVRVHRSQQGHRPERNRLRSGCSESA